MPNRTVPWHQLSQKHPYRSRIILFGMQFRGNNLVPPDVV